MKFSEMNSRQKTNLILIGILVFILVVFGGIWAGMLANRGERSGEWFPNKAETTEAITELKTVGRVELPDSSALTGLDCLTLKGSELREAVGEPDESYAYKNLFMVSFLNGKYGVGYRNTDFYTDEGKSAYPVRVYVRSKATIGAGLTIGMTVKEMQEAAPECDIPKAREITDSSDGIGYKSEFVVTEWGIPFYCAVYFDRADGASTYAIVSRRPISNETPLMQGE